VAQGQHQASLTFDFLEPAVTDSSTAAGLGISGLLPNGEQYTSFAGSPANRIQNIVVASEKFNGVLVGPGQILSMADTLGNVSLDTGYSEGLIIMGNRTIKGTGGGVCQVSTTLFRTVFMTGFPVLERYAHAYRVMYYEGGDGPVHLGPGFDATVFVPDVDFKFLNDSGSWILMETEVNTVKSRLIWRFYGTSDGRSVTYTSTGIQNEVDPPAPKWYPSTDVAPGKWKQIDYPVKGADVTVTRNVWRSAQLLFSDFFRTHYIPWPAQCLFNKDTPVSDGSPCPPK
jgi:vancomycin resistance protein YoaR